MEQTTRERGGDFNLTGIAPGEDAQPTAIAVFGSVEVKPPKST